MEGHGSFRKTKQRERRLNFVTNTRKGCSSSDIGEEARGRFIEWLWRQIKRTERRVSRGGLLQPTWWEGRCLGRCCTSSCWAVTHWQGRAPAPAHRSPGGAQAWHQQNRLLWSQQPNGAVWGQSVPHRKVSSGVHSLVKLWIEKCSQLESCASGDILDERVQRRSAGMTAYTTKLSPEQKGLELLNWDFGSCEDMVSHLLHVKFC